MSHSLAPSIPRNNPIVVPYLIPYITLFKEFRPQLICLKPEALAPKVAMSRSLPRPFSPGPALACTGLLLLLMALPRGSMYPIIR